MSRQIKGQIAIPEYLSELEKPKNDILNYINTGSKNAVKRNWLCTLTKLKDRAMRDMLHESRKKIPVINLQNGKGYFIPDMNDEMDVNMLIRWVRQEESRIKESQLIVDTAKKTLTNCGIDWGDDI